AIEREADARGGRTEPVDGVVGAAAILVRGDRREAQIGLYAEHQCVSLNVVAQLHATEEAVDRLVLIVRVDQPGRYEELRARPVSDMRTCIEPRPIHRRSGGNDRGFLDDQ